MSSTFGQRSGRWQAKRAEGDKTPGQRTKLLDSKDECLQWLSATQPQKHTRWSQAKHTPETYPETYPGGPKCLPSQAPW